MKGLADGAIRVGIHVAGAGERALALAAVGEQADLGIEEYDGLVVGWLRPEQAAELAARGMPVEEAPVPDREDGGAIEEGAEQDEAPAPHTVRLRGPMQPAWRDAIAGLGVRFECAIGELAYRAIITAEQAVSLRALDFVAAVQRVSIAPVGIEEGGEESFEPSEIRTFEAAVWRDADLDGVVAVLRAEAEVRVLDAGADTVRFAVRSDHPVLARLRAMPLIAAVRAHRAPSLFCTGGRAAIGADAVAAAPPGLTGEGEIVGVLDSNIDAHRDLAPAIVSQRALPGCLARDTVGHGTHVAGIIAGRGLDAGTVKGVAPAARLVILAVTDDTAALRLPVDWAAMFDPVVADGAAVINLSWGVPLGGVYAEGSAKLDRYAYQHPEVLMVVAAGNDGNAIASGEHAYRTVGAPATARNAITVGACATPCDRAGCPRADETWGQRRPKRFPKPPASEELLFGAPLPRTAALSSRGPTDYESVKPDVLAPGVCIESTRAATILTDRFEACPTADATYVCSTGTSMAAPFVSGAAALLRQWLRVERALARPSAALVKALLLASARRIGTATARQELAGYPDYDQGYGMVDLATLFPAGGRIGFRDIRNDSPEALVSRSPTTGSIRSVRFYQFEIPAGATGRLRVVLTWTDFPGNFVQNQLALEVRTPSGTSLAGNHERKQAQSPFGGVTFDRQNSCQLVSIAAPEPGAYRVRVLAHNTAFPAEDPRQGFALVVAGELAGDQLVEVTGD